MKTEASQPSILMCILIAISAVIILAGCGPNGFQFTQDQASSPELSPEYADFSDLPLAKLPQKTVTDTPLAEKSEAQNTAAEEKPADNKPIEVRPPVETAPAADTKAVEKPKSNEIAKPEPAKPIPPSKPEVKPIEQKKPVITDAPEIAGVKPLKGSGTVYYMPVYGEKRNCSKSDYAYIRDEKLNVLARLCHDEVANCALQGSCFYIQNKTILLFAYKGYTAIKVPGTQKQVMQPLFRINPLAAQCPQGMGAFKVCLDPYRSVAADPSFFKMGDVIFVPILRGKILPNGETHDGYMTVRDTGGDIHGSGRFDFFIGFDDYHNHLFNDLKLTDKDVGFTYYRIPEDIAQEVRSVRAYPLVPSSVYSAAVVIMKN
jgi:3D (Asp-Asp-Asp) domain-containing protein